MADTVETMECDTTSPEIDPELAEQLKAEGNTAYTNKDYQRAKELYSQAIHHAPGTAAYYGNRCATLMMLYDYSGALEDARRSIVLNEGFTKGYLRAAKCHLMMGNPSLSMDWYDKALLLQPRNTQAVEEKVQARGVQLHLERADEEFNKQQFRTAVYHLDRCLDAAPYCVRFKTLKAEALAMCGQLDNSVALCNELLRSDSSNADAIYVKGLCLYYQDSIDKAYQFFQRVLRNDPDHRKARTAIQRSKQLLAKKEAGNAAFKRYSYQEAYDLYSEALSIDPQNITTNAKLYCNRALMASKLSKVERAIRDCAQAIQLDPQYIKAYRRRAGLYQQNDQHEDAVRDLKKVLDMERTAENKQAVRDGERQLKLSKRKDYYKLLEVDRSASSVDIKKAYRKMALRHHPDRHADADPAMRELEEQKFKEISEAYTVLSDPRKKQRYDSGQDLEEMGGMDIDPSDLFSNFFAGGHSPFAGGFQYGGGFPSSSGGANSFTFQF